MIANRRGVIIVAQATSQKVALDDYCEGAKRDGIKCVVRQSKFDPRNSEARITDLVSVAKEIALTRNYIRTPRKRAQIRAFIEFVKRERKVLKPSAARAREIVAEYEREFWYSSEKYYSILSLSNP